MTGWEGTANHDDNSAATYLIIDTPIVDAREAMGDFKIPHPLPPLVGT